MAGNITRFSQSRPNLSGENNTGAAPAAPWATLLL